MGIGAVPGRQFYHAVVDHRGRGGVSSVVVALVDANPVQATRTYLFCLLSNRCNPPHCSRPNNPSHPGVWKWTMAKMKTKTKTKWRMAMWSPDRRGLDMSGDDGKWKEGLRSLRSHTSTPHQLAGRMGIVDAEGAGGANEWRVPVGSRRRSRGSFRIGRERPQGASLRTVWGIS